MLRPLFNELIPELGAGEKGLDNILNLRNTLN